MKDKPKLMILGSYPRQDGIPRGGPDAVAEVLANGIARSGDFEVHILTGVQGIKSREFRCTDSGVNIHTFPLHNTAGVLTHFFIDGRRIRSIIKEIKPDLLHFNGGGIYASCAIKMPFPSVLTIHGIPANEIGFERGYSRLQWRLSMHYRNDVMRHAKHAICLNSYTFDKCSKWIRDADIRYIDNPVDDDFFGLSNDEVVGDLLLLAVKRRLKDQETAINAVDKLKKSGRNVRLYLIGAASDAGYDAELKQLVEQNKLGDCVIFKDQLARDEVIEYFRRCSIVVLSSLVENAPVVISEAMAAGKAIVTTSAGGISEMVENEKTALVVPFTDSNAMAEAIERLLNDRGLRSRLGTAAKIVAEGRFRKNVAVKKTMAFYHDILNISAEKENA